MPFLFAHVCDLFQQVEDLPPGRRDEAAAVRLVLQRWFAQHRAAVDAMIQSSSASSSASSSPSSSSSATALLSALLPERRSDRVYGLQARGLQRVLVRALGLGHSRIPELARWMRPSAHATTGPVDLADCVEALLRRTVRFFFFPWPTRPDRPTDP